MMDNEILKSCEQEAQIRMGRIPKKLTDENIRAVIERLKKFIEENSFSQTQLAKMLGVGKSKLNQIIKGQYKSRLAIYEVINKASSFMDSAARKKRIEQRGYIETNVAKRIATLITRTEALSSTEGKIGLLIGDSGHGKTTCLEEFSRSNLNTFYIVLDDRMRSKELFAAIAEELGVDSDGSFNAIKPRVEQALQNRHVIIILDEAAGLRVSELNLLRQVIVVKCHCPLILAGNADLLKTVMQPNTRRGCESLDQFTSRLSYILNLDEEASEKGGGLYTSADIRKLYEYGGISLTAGAVGSLKKIYSTTRSGRLHTCANLLTALHTSVKIRARKQISAKDIVEAIAELRLPVSVWLPIATLEKTDELKSGTVSKAG